MAMTYESKLPDKPSELIRVALGDLGKCLADPRYFIDMRAWHMTHADRVFGGARGTKYCSVCLAGAVLAKTFKVSPDRATTPNVYFGREDNKSDRNKLEAVDDFRRGYVQRGLTRMGFDLARRHGVLKEAFQLGFGRPTFDEDRPEHFIAGMGSLADELERAGY